AAIEEISRLHQRGAAAGPAPAGIDQLCPLKNPDERVHVTMDVADCYNTLRGSRGSDAQRNRQNQTSNGRFVEVVSHRYNTAPAPFSATSLLESATIESCRFNTHWIWSGVR